MRAIIKQPGMRPMVIRIDNKLEALQAAVGGYIETLTVAADCCLICNEEGRLMALPENRVLGIDLLGTVLVVGVAGEEFCDVPDEAINMVFQSEALHLAERVRQTVDELRRTTAVMHELEDTLDAMLAEEK